MGGMLSFLIAAGRPDKVVAVVPFYGFPPPEMEPDWAPDDSDRFAGTWPSTTTSSRRKAPKALEAKLQAMGKDVTLTVHPGTGHAFMAPHNALGTLNEEVASVIWPQVISFLHENSTEHPRSATPEAFDNSRPDTGPEVSTHRVTRSSTRTARSR